MEKQGLSDHCQLLGLGFLSSPIAEGMQSPLTIFFPGISLEARWEKPTVGLFHLQSLLCKNLVGDPLWALSLLCVCLLFFPSFFQETVNEA